MNVYKAKKKFVSFPDTLPTLFISDEGDFESLVKSDVLEEILGLISGSLPENQGGFTFWGLLLGIFFFYFHPRVFLIMFMLFLIG